MRDIGLGCEGIDLALEKWLSALAAGEAYKLEDILRDDFQLTCDVAIAGGRMNKVEFIAFDSHIVQSDIEVLAITARRHDDVAISQVFARVDERFSGDPAGTTAQHLSGIVGGRIVAYASAWSPDGAGSWKCFQHHVFGPVD